MIDLFFTVFNCFLLLGLIAYAIRSYVLPMLKARMEKDKTAEQRMHEEHRTLLSEQRKFDESIAAQEIDCSGFLQKIDRWKQAVEADKIERRKQVDYLKEKIEKRVELQSKYHALRVRYEQLVPLVVNQLEADTRNHFNNERVAHNYLQQVLKHLKK